jgi:hypothetical protein
MKPKKTHRGFVDYYSSQCSLQKSSHPKDDAIWLVMKDGTRWVKYPPPDDASLTARMHLTHDQVAELLPHLTHFVKTGEI